MWPIRFFVSVVKQSPPTLKGTRRKWMDRHVHDPFVKAAKLQAYRSRAAFKLLEIDEKHKLLKSGMLVVDVGAAPGGWSQVIADKTSSKKGSETCVAVDLLEMLPV
jgi:23S rRNA (uridine2552-2'-O)-methyltransferase